MSIVTVSFNTIETNDRNISVTKASPQKMAEMSKRKKEVRVVVRISYVKVYFVRVSFIH